MVAVPEFRGLEVVVEAAAAGGRSTLVFLHEGLGSAGSWRDLPRRLAAESGCGALAYSRHGHGASPVLVGPREVSFMHEEAVLLGDLLAALELRTPILVGHSDGASIALIQAALSPAATAPRALVLIAPHLFVEDRTIAAIAAARDAFATTGLCLRLGRYHRDPLRTFRGWNDVWLDSRFRAWDIRPLVERIVCPVLAIQGEADEYGTMAQLDELAARLRGPLTQLRLPGCGHSPHREQPDAVGVAIAEFLAPLSARAAD